MTPVLSVATPPPAHNPVLRAVSLTRRFRTGQGFLTALSDTSLALHAGDFAVLQGPSGSGKSTLIHLLGLLDRPDHGQVWFDGEDTATLSDDARARLRGQRIGFVFQGFNLVPVLTAAENVALPALLESDDGATRTEVARTRAHELLDAVHLGARAQMRPDLLSGGERQRVALARALVNRPALVLADEPTANLDSVTAATVINLMRQLCQEQGTAFLIATHDPRVSAHARRLFTMNDGQLTESPVHA